MIIIAHCSTPIDKWAAQQTDRITMTWPMNCQLRLKAIITMTKFNKQIQVVTKRSNNSKTAPHLLSKLCTSLTLIKATLNYMLTKNNRIRSKSSNNRIVWDHMKKPNRAITIAFNKMAMKITNFRAILSLSPLTWIRLQHQIYPMKLSINLVH